MNAAGWVVLSLLLVADFVAVASAIGVLVMRDPFQRLHFVAPAATVSTALITIAVGVGGLRTQAVLKTATIGGLLLAVNGVVTHATARAARLRGTKLAGSSPPEAH